MIYSISHNDLDGYASQLLIKKYAKKIKEKIEMYNVNYGKAILETLKLIENKLKKEDIIIITDLNLDQEIAIYLDNLIAKKIVIDHHETGKMIAKKYDWYFYNKSKSATLLTYEYFSSYLKKYDFIKYTNMYDLWLENKKKFNKAKSLNYAFKNLSKNYSKDIENLRRDFVFFLIESYSFVLEIENSVYFAEKELYNIERHYLTEKEFNFKEPIDSLRIKKHYKYIIENKLYEDINFNGYKFRLFFNMNDIFQEILHLTLNNNKDLDFVCHLNKQGFISFRSLKINVEKFAKTYFNGGGHRLASGGSLNGARKNIKFKENEIINIFKSHLIIS